jgi:hypothetical protein
MYEAAGDVLRGISPNYKHGIIMEVSTVDANSVIVLCYDCNKKREGMWVIFNRIHDDFEVLSGASNV